MIYLNHKGEEVDTNKLSDKDLVLSHRWFRKYCKSLENIYQDAEVDDTQYANHITSMVAIRDALEAETKNRKLKKSLY